MRVILVNVEHCSDGREGTNILYDKFVMVLYMGHRVILLVILLYDMGHLDHDDKIIINTIRARGLSRRRFGFRLNL